MRNSKYGRLVVWNSNDDAVTPAQLAENLDRIDAMIGGPDGSPGPTGSKPSGTPSQWLDLGNGANDPYNRTLYSIIQGLNYNDVPLGTVTMWWRPSASVALPDGWVPCDGSTYVNNPDASPSIILHSYAQTSITVPDFRGVFPMGAYNSTASTKTTATVTSDLQRDGQSGTSTRTDNPKDAPGIGYSSRTVNAAAGTGQAITANKGSNIARDLTHQHPPGSYRAVAHLHNFTHYHKIIHTHYFEHEHDVGAHFHYMDHNHGMDHTHVYDHAHIVGDRDAIKDPPSGIYVPGFVSAGGRVWTSSAATISAYGTRNFGLGQQPQTSAPLNIAGFGSNAAWRNVTDGSSLVYTSSRVDSGSTAATGLPIDPNGGAPPVQTSLPSTADSGTALRPDGTYDHTDLSTETAVIGQSDNQAALAGKVDPASLDILPGHIAVLFIIKIKVSGHLT